jgi:predicted dithiol-disulfide oxidoreductase (DUF899 family)
MAPPPTTLDDYLKAHEALLEQERRLAHVAQEVASGTLPVSELDELARIVDAHRALVQAVLQRAIADLKRP